MCHRHIFGRVIFSENFCNLRLCSACATCISSALSMCVAHIILGVLHFASMDKQQSLLAAIYPLSVFKVSCLPLDWGGPLLKSVQCCI